MRKGVELGLLCCDGLGCDRVRCDGMRALGVGKGVWDGGCCME